MGLKVNLIFEYLRGRELNQQINKLSFLNSIPYLVILTLIKLKLQQVFDNSGYR